MKKFVEKFKQTMLMVIVLAAVAMYAIIYFRVALLVAPYSNKGGIYTGTANGQNLILVFDEENPTMTLYTYIKEDGFYYGFKNVYSYGGEYYNRIIGNLHIRSNPGLLFFLHMAIYNEDIEERVYLQLKIIENTSLNLSDEYKPLQGKFKEDMVITENTLKIDDLSFKKADDNDMDAIKDVIKEFELYEVSV